MVLPIGQMIQRGTLVPAGGRTVRVPDHRVEELVHQVLAVASAPTRQAAARFMRGETDTLPRVALVELQGLLAGYTGAMPC